MDDGDDNGGGRFKIKQWSDAAEVLNVHKAGAKEVGEVVSERETRIKNNTKIVNRGI